MSHLEKPETISAIPMTMTRALMNWFKGVLQSQQRRTGASDDAKQLEQVEMQDMRAALSRVQDEKQKLAQLIQELFKEAYVASGYWTDEQLEKIAGSEKMVGFLEEKIGGWMNTQFNHIFRAHSLDQQLQIVGTLSDIVIVHVTEVVNQFVSCLDRIHVADLHDLLVGKTNIIPECVYAALRVWMLMTLMIEKLLAPVMKLKNKLIGRRSSGHTGKVSRLNDGIGADYLVPALEAVAQYPVLQAKFPLIMTLSLLFDTDVSCSQGRGWPVLFGNGGRTACYITHWLVAMNSFQQQSNTVDFNRLDKEYKAYIQRVKTEQTSVREEQEAKRQKELKEIQKTLWDYYDELKKRETMEASCNRAKSSTLFKATGNIQVNYATSSDQLIGEETSATITKEDDRLTAIRKLHLYAIDNKISSVERLNDLRNLPKFIRDKIRPPQEKGVLKKLWDMLCWLVGWSTTPTANEVLQEVERWQQSKKVPETPAKTAEVKGDVHGNGPR